jgi:hypothetical protein
MTMRALIVAAACVFATGALAQTPEPVLPSGVRARIILASDTGMKIIGNIGRADSQRVEMGIATTTSLVEVPWRDVSSVATSAGKDHAKGTRLGLLAGAVAGGITYLAYQHEASKDQLGYNKLGLVLLSYIILPAVGAGVGLALSPELWTSQPAPPHTEDTGRLLLQLSPVDLIRIRTATGTVSGRAAYSGDSLSLVTRGTTAQYRWSDVTALEIQGGLDRGKGALRGAAVLTLITVIGVATDPMPTARQNFEVAVSNALIGAVIGAVIAPKGWLRLPVPSR